VKVRNPDGFLVVLAAIWGDAFVKTEYLKEVISFGKKKRRAWELWPADTKFTRRISMEIEAASGGECFAATCVERIERN
jgi:hypothetical protein